MKNKAYTYILLPAVILIWGIAGYRFFAYTSDGDPRKQAPAAALAVEKPAREYTLLSNYRDPFFDKPEPVVKKASSPATASPANRPRREEPLRFKYKGLIRKGKLTYAIIESGGRQEVLRVRDEIDGFSVRSIAHDSVVLGKGSSRNILKIQ